MPDKLVMMLIAMRSATLDAAYAALGALTWLHAAWQSGVAASAWG